MTTCITGANGFIGSHLVDTLLARGHRIRALVRASSNLRWLRDKDVELVIADPQRQETLEAFVAGADYIYHVAGVVKARSWDEYVDGNVTMVEALLRAAASSAPDLRRFLHVSSQTVAGPAPALDQPATEDGVCRPITRYGKSKLQAEASVRALAGTLPCTIVRPCAVYGPRDTEIFMYFQTLARGLNSMVGFTEKRLNLIHVRDLVDGFILAAEADAAIGKAYFLASREFYSWPEVSAATKAVLGRFSIPVRVPHVAVFSVAAVAQAVAALRRRAATLNIEKAKDLTRRYWICSIDKAACEIGFQPQLTLEAGIRDTIGWYREQGWLK